MTNFFIESFLNVDYLKSFYIVTYFEQQSIYYFLLVVKRTVTKKLKKNPIIEGYQFKYISIYLDESKSFYTQTNPRAKKAYVELKRIFECFCYINFLIKFSFIFFLKMYFVYHITQWDKRKF